MADICADELLGAVMDEVQTTVIEPLLAKTGQVIDVLNSTQLQSRLKEELTSLRQIRLPLESLRRAGEHCGRDRRNDAAVIEMLRALRSIAQTNLGGLGKLDKLFSTLCNVDSFFGDEFAQVVDEKLTMNDRAGALIALLTDEIDGKKKDDFVEQVQTEFMRLQTDVAGAATKVRMLNMLTLGAGTTIAEGTRLAPAGATRFQRRGDDWLETTVYTLAEYVRGRRDDAFISGLVEREDLGWDASHFWEILQPIISKLNLLVKKLEENADFSFHLSKDACVAELRRTWYFSKALVLNTAETKSAHSALAEHVLSLCLGVGDEGSMQLPIVTIGNVGHAAGEHKRRVGFLCTLMGVATEAILNTHCTRITTSFQNIFGGDVTLQSSKLLPDGRAEIGFLASVNTKNLQTLFKTVMELGRANVRHVLVGDYSLDVGEQPVMNPRFNRIYGEGLTAEGFTATRWKGAIDRAGRSYYCPHGWRRFSLNVARSPEEFDRLYGGWPIAYHGTRNEFAASILTQGLRPGHINVFGKGVYLSPSIIYSGHPRYARIWKYKGKYIQMVLQVRVNPSKMEEGHPGTLPGAFPNDPCTADPDFPGNKNLEWLVREGEAEASAIVIYGIMVRVTDVHPGRLPESSWWSEKYRAET